MENCAAKCNSIFCILTVWAFVVLLYFPLEEGFEAFFVFHVRSVCPNPTIPHKSPAEGTIFKRGLGVREGRKAKLRESTATELISRTSYCSISCSLALL